MSPHRPPREGEIGGRHDTGLGWLLVVATALTIAAACGATIGISGALRGLGL